MQERPVPLTKQTAVGGLVLLVTLTGARLGVIGTLDGTASGVTPVPTRTATPTPATVEATAPATPSSTETPAGTPTEQTTVPMETATGVSTNLSIAATDPSDIANPAGQVYALRGYLSGTLSWSGDVDSIVLIVSSWSPHDEWVEKRRVSFAPEGESVALADVLDQTHLLYATGDRATAFNNPDDATEVTRRGYVGVTAVFFHEGEEVRRQTQVAAYSFDVRNDRTIDVSLDAFEGEQAIINVSNAYPGAAGSETLTVANTGTTTGSLQLFIQNVQGSENGFAESEVAVDDDQTSELLDAIAFRVAAIDGGDRTYLIGGPDRYTTLSRYPDARLSSHAIPSGEAVQIVLEWEVQSGTGNEVMTDSVSFDLKFQLASDDTG